MGEESVVQAKDIGELLAAKRIANSGFSVTTDLAANGKGILKELQWALEQIADLATVDVRRIPVHSLRPFWGPIITFFKRAVRKSTYWLYQPLFQRITGFNMAVINLLYKIILSLEEVAKDTKYSLLEESWESLRTRLDEREKRQDEMNQRLSSKIEALEKFSKYCEDKLKEALAGVSDDKAELQREVIEVKQRVQDMFREFTSLRRLVEDYRAEAAFLRAKLALALHYKCTGSWPTSKEKGLEQIPQLFEGLNSDDTTWLYHAFEQQFRGPEKLIKERQHAYLPDVKKAYEVCGGYVLDLGAGRGEFLEICSEAGIPAIGVDLNEAMVNRCQEKGLEVKRADALAYLGTLPDESLSAVTAFQVVEHLEFEEIWRLVQTALVKLKPGGVLILETINPHNLASLMNFYLDFTHKRPIPAPTLRFLLEAVGFRGVEVRFSSPCSEEEKLQGEGEKTKKLNQVLFGPQDYAVLGWR